MFPLAHPCDDVLGLADSLGHNRQGRIFTATGCKLAAFGYEKIIDIVCLSPLVYNAISLLLAHTTGTQIMGRGYCWGFMCPDRACGVKNRAYLLEEMASHCQFALLV